MVVLAPAKTGAESSDNLRKMASKPIEITADELVAERHNNRVIFKGNVMATQDELVIYADELVAQYDKEGKNIDRIEAEGNVRVVQKGIREARGERAVFVNATQVVELQGNAVVSEGESRLLGDKLIIYLVENRSVIMGGEEGRVKAIINPEKFIKKPEEKQK
jgi:lipopolysaccharide export system protein LptA